MMHVWCHYEFRITNMKFALVTRGSTDLQRDFEWDLRQAIFKLILGINCWNCTQTNVMGAYWSVYIGSDYYLNHCSQRSMSSFSCLRLHQWPVTYLITLSNWIMSCQSGRHAVVTVCEPDWKHKWAACKSFDATSSFNNLSLLFLRNRSLQILQRYVMCPPRGIREISMGFSP